MKCLPVIAIACVATLAACSIRDERTVQVPAQSATVVTAPAPASNTIVYTDPAPATTTTTVYTR